MGAMPLGRPTSDPQGRLPVLLAAARRQEGTDLLWSLAMISQLLREGLVGDGCARSRAELDRLDRELLARLRAGTPAPDLLAPLAALAAQLGCADLPT